MSGLTQCRILLSIITFAMLTSVAGPAAASPALPAGSAMERAAGGVQAAGVSPTGITSPDDLTRIAGTDRYDTAVRISRNTFPDGSAPTVVIASGANWPDALGGASLAGAVRGPVLLVRPDSLPAVVADEIRRLGATTAIVLGGTGAVKQETMDAIDALPGVGVSRIGGADRYETARQIAMRVRVILGSAYDGTVLLTTGVNYPDALAASPLAARKWWPVLLTRPEALSASTSMALSDLGATRVIVLGGTAAVSGDAVLQAERVVYASATRLAGADRYDTAAVIADFGVANADLGWDGLALATGRQFADALVGGSAQGARGSVLLLTEPDSLPAATSATLARRKEPIRSAVFLGGSGAINDAVETRVAEILMAPGHPEVADLARGLIGVPYQWGGQNPEYGFMNSTFTWYCYDQIGISIPKLSASAQFTRGDPVDEADLIPGDLVFFGTSPSTFGITDVGIYLGDRRCAIGPSGPGEFVSVGTIDRFDYVGARRP